MAASNSEKRSSKSSDGYGSSLSPSRRQKSSPASVAGGSSRWKYDVFLSFTSEDTRKNFTDHLYAALIQKGIITFRDDERLERGTEISSKLTKAIEESRFSIVIFSKNYASSTWCLEELVKIVECMLTNNHTGIPVFYDVEPSDVRKQKGEFEKAFDKHEQNQNLDYNKVQRWRAALAQVCNFSGWHLSYARPEVQRIKDIVNDISRRLNITFSNFFGDLVGMDHHLNKMNAYLEVESDDVRFIGIWGTEGIGKTTIARAVFEMFSYKYEASCFLGNIREGYERSGLVALQEQLLSQVLKEKNLHISDVYEGIALIRRRLRYKMVFIVLDDVDDQLEQLIKLAGSHDWFGPKSRIIVTTRYENVLESHAIKYIYKVGGLNHDDALQLFHMKAFKNKNPTDDHVNLSKHIVNYAHGIPLALEVLGSYLCDRTVEEWKSALNSLQDYPDGKDLSSPITSPDKALLHLFNCLKLTQNQNLQQKEVAKNDGEKKAVPGAAEKEVAKNDGEKKAVPGAADVDVVVLKMILHCEGCAMKVRRCIMRKFQGVTDVKTEIWDNKVTVTGKVDPAKVRAILEAKLKKKVDLISPPPKKDTAPVAGSGDKKPDQKKQEDKKLKAKSNKIPEEKKPEPPKEEKKSKIPLTHDFMSEVRESFSSGFLKPLEDMVSSPKVSDFFRRLKLNEKWLNGFKINLQSLGWILGDAEWKAYVNKEVKVWLDKLNEVSYDLEDLLDEIVTEELSDHQDKPRYLKIQNQGIFSAELSLFEIVEEITVKIENLQRQSETLGLWPKASRIKREPCQQSVRRDCFEDESHLIGRDEDKEAIIKLLLSDDDHRTHVITMAGERGVGKTTLAQFVYNDERVEKQFDFKAFIHLSDDFDELLLTRAVLHAFTYRCSNNDDLSSLQTSLKEVLKGKKFLLVLDNFTMHSDGGKLQKFLTAGANGSRIIVTERHKQFEETMGTLTAYTVRSLTKEESWLLFAKHAFPDKNSSLHPELEDIGKEIVEKCHGLPLAVKILASVLHFKPVEEWQALLNNNSILKWDNEDPITSFLEMSYNDLPIHLKRCVAYCSIFPTHHEYEEEKLILLWMAEGFLQQKEGTRTQEVGCEYFHNLTYRSFFQPSGANKSCFIMHDLLKDIALVESGFICSRMGSNQNSEVSKVSSKTRHVLISGCRYIAERCKAICACKYLRTLILYRSSWDIESCQLSVELLNELFEALQCLRVLSLSRSEITILSDSIGELKYLRFLDLSYTEITGLPDSVSSLHKLQTLLLSHCSRLTKLPESVPKISSLQFLDHSYTAITWLPDSLSSLHKLQTWLLSHCSVTYLPDNMRELNDLRHLDIRGTNLKQMPEDMSYLTRLQYLSDFFVGKVSGSQIEQLEHLSNLQGTLHISQLQDLESAGVASEARLKNKAYLQGLELEWSNAVVDSQNETGVLEQLEPHKNLEKLSIISYGGTRFPNWLGDSSFFKIVFLCLSNCNSCSHLPPLGQLPSLKELEIKWMNGVKMVGPEFYGMNSSSDEPFPSLEILVFQEMLEWEEWISPEVEFPRLKRICISGCPRLAKCPSVFFPRSPEVAISECPLLVPVRDDLLLHDGNKMQFGSDDKVAGRPPIRPVMEEIQLPDSYGVQLKHESEIASQSLEHRTDVLMTSHSSPPELSKLSTESTLPKLPVMVEKQVQEGNNRKEKLLDRPSTSRLSEVEELKLPDINVVQSTDVSITSNRLPPESPTCLTEDSSAKHVGASDYSSAATEFSSDTDTDDPNNDEGDKAQFRRNEKLLDRPSTSRLQETEELQLPDSNVVQSTDVSVTSNRPIQESPTPLTEDSSAKHEGALDTYSAATEISSYTVTDDPIDDEGDKAQFRSNKKQLDRPSISRLREIEELQLPDSNVVQSTEVLVTSNRPTPESPTPLTEDSSAKHVGALDTSSAATEISSDTDTDTDDAINVSEISQLKRLPRKLYSLKIESCKALESLTEELMSVNLKQLYIMDCQYFKSIEASHLPFALKTLYIRRCKKLEFLSVEETTGKHTSVEHLCIESSCDPLKSFPLALFPKLRNLSICDCANFNSISITEDHNTLNSLEIRDCKNLESLWKSGLGTPKLTSILLSNCKKLKQLPGQLHGLTSLQSLLIKECPELDSIPKGGLPSSLNLLRISSCHKLTPCLQWGLHRLNKFIRFEIEGGCRDLESFPEQNLLPRNLNSLQFSRFPNLKVLNYVGLQHLTSLETLKINSCDKLQFLPEEGLPSSLSYLYISDCPLLKSKLQNRRGSEWYKIAHITHIQIDGKVIS